MKITLGFGLLFVCIWCSSTPSFAVTVNVLEPIKPLQYQPMIGKGFATSFFKSSRNLKEYRQNGAKFVQDVKARGLQNLRLRCRADLDDEEFVMSSFLNDLEKAVDDCLTNDVTPIISWIHHEAEAHATVEHRTNYVSWWTSVAERLKNKNYRLSFNLFTELGIDGCDDDCSESLRLNTKIYNDWTTRVVNAIRATGGNNEKRILILASPKKEAKGLKEIDPLIYKDDEYMMAEWHLYAGGPNKRIFRNEDGSFKKYSAKYWNGDGTTAGRANVDKMIAPATKFTTDTGVQTYFGAWMAQRKDLNQVEVLNFVNYFVNALGNIPWSVNEFNNYYDTKEMKWNTTIQEVRESFYIMSLVLDASLQ